jgi:hypothetical protein
MTAPTYYTLTSILERPTDLQAVQAAEQDHKEQRAQDCDRVGHAWAQPPETVKRKSGVTPVKPKLV